MSEHQERDVFGVDTEHGHYVCCPEHKSAIEEQAAAEARRELLAKVRTIVEAASYHRNYRAALLDIHDIIEPKP